MQITRPAVASSVPAALPSVLVAPHQWCCRALSPLQVNRSGRRICTCRRRAGGRSPPRCAIWRWRRWSTSSPTQAVSCSLRRSAPRFRQISPVRRCALIEALMKWRRRSVWLDTARRRSSIPVALYRERCRSTRRCGSQYASCRSGHGFEIGGPGALRGLGRRCQRRDSPATFGATDSRSAAGAWPHSGPAGADGHAVSSKVASEAASHQCSGRAGPVRPPA